MGKSAAIWLAMGSSVCSSLAAIFQVSATKILSPLVVAAAGSLLGGMIIYLTIVLTRRSISLDTLRKTNPDMVVFILLRGIVGGIVFNVALSLTSGIKAVFFTKAEPYFILLWRWMLDGEKASPRHLKLLGVHLFGAVVLSTGGQFAFSASHLGDVLLLIAVAILGYTYRLGTRLALARGALETSALLQLTSGLVLAFPAMLFLPSEERLLSATGWQHLVWYVLLFNVLALSSWLVALKHLESWIVSALRAVGPLVAAPFAWLFFGEELNSIQLCGGALVLATSWLIAREWQTRRQ